MIDVVLSPASGTEKHENQQVHCGKPAARSLLAVTEGFLGFCSPLLISYSAVLGSQARNGGKST